MFIIKKIISSFYFIVIKLILFLYAFKILRPQKTTSKIISIGNITVGGTGKTPMIIYFSKLFSKWNINHGIISRGYGRMSSGEVVVNDGKKTCVDVNSSGDESQMLSLILKNIPIIIGNKISACKLQEQKFNSEMILVDDGFQTFELDRFLDIVLIDLSSNLEDYCLLPSGKLREPLSSLKRADILIFTKQNYSSLDAKIIEKKILGLINKKNTLVTYANLASAVLKYKNKSFLEVGKKIVDENIVAFAGIGNADSFRSIIKKNFSNIQKTYLFKDHHNYLDEDIIAIKKTMKKLQSTTIVTTLKDFVKIKNVFIKHNIYVVDIKHDIVNENLLFEYLKLHLN